MRALSIFLFFFVRQPVQSALIPVGTSVDARLETPVATATSNTGDSVVAIMAESIRIGGEVVVPRGSRLNGRVETIEPASRTSEGRVRLVFREIQWPDGRRAPTWITNSFSASLPKRKIKYPLYIGIGGAAGGLIAGKTARATGIIGGLLVGFIIASNSATDNLPDLTLKSGQLLHLQFGEDLRLE